MRSPLFVGCFLEVYRYPKGTFEIFHIWIYSHTGTEYGGEEGWQAVSKMALNPWGNRYWSFSMFYIFYGLAQSCTSSDGNPSLNWLSRLPAEILRTTLAFRPESRSVTCNSSNTLFVALQTISWLAWWDLCCGSGSGIRCLLDPWIWDG